jgi:RHH-type proline utilization regulon transcriptional repressor/proline dehydrogenase/delta 1-pyrroline-5-carboxylate dehydrogenase
MRARDLDDAIALQNAPEFGLTGGLHSLDPHEIEYWTDRVHVGNAYVNRHTTGAIVRRQPFGGWKHSSVGPGAKTGGPNDILRFVRYEQTRAGTGDYEAAWRSTFGIEHDDAHLRSEANILRYRPVEKVVARVGNEQDAGELRRAAGVTNVPLELAPNDDVRIASSGATRLRALVPISDDLARACHRANIAIDDTPVTGNARIELPRWLREQAISRTLHRHGRIAGR